MERRNGSTRSYDHAGPPAADQRSKSSRRARTKYPPLTVVEPPRKRPRATV
jgi:hypothetical protein